MEIVEDRYGAGSTLITSQLPLEIWHEVIGDPTFADAILDRIVHNAYRLSLKGPLMRKPGADTTMQTVDDSSGASEAPGTGALSRTRELLRTKNRWTETARALHLGPAQPTLRAF